jgi:hypothetical protein
MKEKIIALLTNKFSGVRKDGLQQMARIIALQVATEDEAKALIDKFTTEQVGDFIKEFRTEIDKEVSESNKTVENNLKKKFDFVEKKEFDITKNPDSTSTKSNDQTDIAAMIKNAVAEAVKPFQTELTNYKTNDVAKTRLQTLNEKLQNCKDNNFKEQTLKDYSRMQFETEEAFAEYLTEKETAIVNINQNIADTTLGGYKKPFFANTNNKEAEKDRIEAITDNII